jgi:hypothetical protein
MLVTIFSKEVTLLFVECARRLKTIFNQKEVGVAQSTSHSPQEQKTRVRIQPGYKVFLGSQSNAVVYNRLGLHCFCVEAEK